LRLHPLDNGDKKLGALLLHGHEVGQKAVAGRGRWRGGGRLPGRRRFLFLFVWFVGEAGRAGDRKSPGGNGAMGVVVSKGPEGAAAEPLLDILD